MLGSSNQLCSYPSYASALTVGFCELLPFLPKRAAADMRLCRAVLLMNVTMAMWRSHVE